jgi:hypothetical protein
MSNPFFDYPILNSPYECPMRYWELDETGQPTQKIIDAAPNSSRPFQEPQSIGIHGEFPERSVPNGRGARSAPRGSQRMD